MIDRAKEYMESRRKGTVHDIRTANGNRAKLISLRAKRARLAVTYAEDGALHTARCIYDIDLPLIDAALKATEVEAQRG